MTYKHPKKYNGIRNQDRARLLVEENCLKCSEFMGRNHDFSECEIGKKCPEPFICPSVFYSKDMIKMEVSDGNEI